MDIEIGNFNESVKIKDLIAEHLDSLSNEEINEAVRIKGLIDECLDNLSKKEIEEYFELERRDVNTRISSLLLKGIRINRIVSASGVPRSTFYRLRKGIGEFDRRTITRLKIGMIQLEAELAKNNQTGNKLNQVMTSCGRMSECGNNLCGGCGDKSS